MSFGIRLISIGHLDSSFKHHTEVFPEDDPRKAWMNFARESDVERLPKGHRALVYVTAPWMKFIWAIQFLDLIKPKDYEKVLLKPHGLTSRDLCEGWPYIRPIRFLSRMSPENDYKAAPTRDDIRKELGDESWTPSYGAGHVFRDEAMYQRLYSIIPWQWVAKGESDSPRNSPLLIVTYMEPPIQGIEPLLLRLKSIQGKSERNMEALVENFLVLLGHDHKHIDYQNGHVDVLLNDENGTAWAVFEVKALLDRASRRDAQRKAFDYANTNGARFAVVTDGNTYEIYDQDKPGRGYEAKFCGSFTLSRFEEGNKPLLDLLRPKK